MHKKINSALALGIVAIAGATASILIWKAGFNKFPPEELTGARGKKACPADAKLCPDGSAVSRSGPDCEFSQCPTGGPIIGGLCDYEKAEGICKINAVLPDNTVKFNFYPDKSFENHPFSDSLKREQIGEMENLLQELDIKIKVGDSVNCQASLITKGTCTPIMFKFIK